jgi:hypothetical protein
MRPGHVCGFATRWPGGAGTACQGSSGDGYRWYQKYQPGSWTVSRPSHVRTWIGTRISHRGHPGVWGGCGVWRQSTDDFTNGGGAITTSKPHPRPDRGHLRRTARALPNFKSRMSCVRRARYRSSRRRHVRVYSGSPELRRGRPPSSGCGSASPPRPESPRSGPTASRALRVANAMACGHP